MQKWHACPETGQTRYALRRVVINNQSLKPADISHIKAHFNNAYVSHILSTSSKEPIQEDFNVLRVLFYDYLLQNVGPDSWILTVDAPYSAQ